MIPQRTKAAQTIGLQIRDARRACGMTQRDLGDKADVPFTRVSFIESGYEIDPDSLRKILMALDDRTSQE